MRPTQIPSELGVIWISGIKSLQQKFRLSKGLRATLYRCLRLGKLQQGYRKSAIYTYQALAYRPSLRHRHHCTSCLLDLRGRRGITGHRFDEVSSSIQRRPESLNDTGSEIAPVDYFISEIESSFAVLRGFS